MSQSLMRDKSRRSWYRKRRVKNKWIKEGSFTYFINRKEETSYIFNNFYLKYKKGRLRTLRVCDNISLVTVDNLPLRSTFRLIITQTLRYAYIQASTLLRYAFQNQKRRARAARTAKKAEVARLIALEAEVQTAEGLRVSMKNMAAEFPQATNLVAVLTQVLSSFAQTEV